MILCKYHSTVFPREKQIEDSGYRVLNYEVISFKDEPIMQQLDLKKGSIITGVGYFLSDVPFASYELSGDFKKEKYGWQYHIKTFHEIIESNKRGIIAFLTSSLIKGCGVSTAEKIYATYGDSTLNVMDKNINSLDSIKGITKKNLCKIKESYTAVRGARDIISFLISFKIKASISKRVYDVLGENSLDIVKENPYVLCNINGISFPTADEVAISISTGLQSKERIRACILYVLKQNEFSGSTGMSFSDLACKARNLLTHATINTTDIREVVKELIDSKHVLYVRNMLYGRDIYQAENDLARAIVNLSLSLNHLIPDLEEKIDEWQTTNKMILAKEQREAVISSLSNGFTVITGGPGTGKTTISKAIVDIRKLYGKKKTLCLMAPTGKASKRMTEATDEPSTTIHSRLQIFNSEDLPNLAEEDLLDAETIIIDEVSMLDMWVGRILFSSIKEGCQVIIVGDIDQLPSVGAGAVLRDTISSGVINVVRLTHIFRQAADNPIVANAYKIRDGITDLKFDREKFILLEAFTFEQSAKYMVNLYAKKVQELGKDNVICLSPHHHADTLTSTDNLNRYSQAKINPATSPEKELKYANITFRVGDLVMQTQNSAEGIANGDIGCVLSIKKDGVDSSMTIQFSDSKVTYEGEELNHLELAYAVTIHKSQGSEYPCVILNLLAEHKVMLKRNLLYTAVTRAKQECWLVSNINALNTAILNEDTNKRHTLLAEKLRQYYNKCVSNNPFLTAQAQ